MLDLRTAKGCVLRVIDATAYSISRTNRCVFAHVFAGYRSSLHSTVQFVITTTRVMMLSSDKVQKAFRRR